MQFDTALNLVWLGLGLVALASTARAVLRQTRRLEKPSPWLHIVGVALIVAALFPYISATDDLLRTEHFTAQHERGPAGKHTRMDNLIRLYEAMDNPLLSEAREIVLVFFFVSLIFTPAIRAANRMAPRLAGRSPPSLVTA